MRPAREITRHMRVPLNAMRSVGKCISLCILCASLCLCGEITKANIHHRGTEITQRTTEKDKPDFPEGRLLAGSGLARTPDGRKSKQQVERVVAADPGVLVSACVMSGNLTVHTWDRREVRARISDGVSIELTRIDQSKSSSATELRLTSTGSRHPKASSCLQFGDVELDVPRGASLKLQTNNGEIRASGVARITATSQSGAITVDGVRDEADLNTIGGELSVRDSTGTFKLHTVGGSIDARDLGSKAAGDFFEAGAVGGDITLDRIRHQRLKINTVSGEVAYSGPLARGGRYSFQSISGRLRMSLPANSSFRLSGTLGNGGDLSSDFKVTTEKASKYSPMRTIDAIVGDGDASINVSYFSGSVQIRKQ